MYTATSHNQIIQSCTCPLLMLVMLANPGLCMVLDFGPFCFFARVDALVLLSQK